MVLIVAIFGGGYTWSELIKTNLYDVSPETPRNVSGKWWAEWMKLPEPVPTPDAAFLASLKPVLQQTGNVRFEYTINHTPDRKKVVYTIEDYRHQPKPFKDRFGEAIKKIRDYGKNYF